MKTQLTKEGLEKLQTEVNDRISKSDESNN